MADGEQDQKSSQADHNSVAVGSLSVGGSVDGSLIIGSHNVVGFTSDQVSTLIAQISTTFQPKPFDGRSPYKGLDVFEEEDAELFFGREKLVEDLIVRLRQSRTLFVTGPSGSGKSSLVRAGLIHALKQGAKELTSERWLYATMKPGRDPIEALANAFSRLKDPGLGKYLRENASQASALHECAESVLTERKDQRLVLFIDQFEEVFTQLSKDKAETFIQWLDCAASIENGRTILLFAMRSDFIPNCVVYPKLNALLNRQFVQIGAMQGDELVSAIAQPALRVGLRIDPDLIAQIINDMQGEPGALPLMQFALKDLFDAQQAKGGLIALTLKDYLERGGIRKALERHADNSFNRLNGHERKLTRAIFSSLIEIGRGTVDTRRTAVFDELVPASARSAEVEAIVRKLADARLLTTDEIGGKDTVTISHEKLIDAWPWLKRLVDENRDVIAAQNEIAKDAKEWDDHGRDPSYLYSGAKLGVAQEQLASNKMVLSGLAKDFIDEGIALRDAERKAKEDLRRRIIGGLIAGISIALVLAAFAVYQMFKAREQANIARAGELDALAIFNEKKHFDLALLLGIEGWGKFKNARTEGSLLSLSNSNLGLHKYLFGHKDSVFSVAFSPDGKLLASSGKDKTIILWNVSQPDSPSQITTLPMQNYVYSVAFSPDGKLLAAGDVDASGKGSVILWDISDTTSLLRLNTLPVPDYVRGVAFSPDGKLLASSDGQGDVILWDVSNPKAASPLAQLPEPSAGAIFSPDGTILVSQNFEDRIVLWDIRNPASPSLLTKLPKQQESITSFEFSPAGKVLALGGGNGNIMLFDVSDPKTILPLPTLPSGQLKVESLAFSADGTVLASGGDDNNVILWDVSNPGSATRAATLGGHGDYVNTLAFSPDKKWLASGSNDRNVILWDVGDSKSTSPLTTLSTQSNSVNSLAFNPDGTILASGSEDQMVTLWDVNGLTPISKLPMQGSVQSISFSPDGKMLASSEGEDVILWDVSNPMSPSNLNTFSMQSYNIKSVAFSPNGKWLAAGGRDASYEGIIILWDISNPKTASNPIKLSTQSDRVNCVVFSPDGKMLVSAENDGKVILWDVSNPTSPFSVKTLSQHKEAVNSVAFRPDGKVLASGSDDYTIILWDVSNPESASVLTPLTGPLFNVNSLTFSRDGKRLASGSGDYKVTLWDVSNPKSGEALSDLSGHSESVSSVAFRPDGKSLVSSGWDGTIILWDLIPQSWIEKSCQRVNRNFTRAEWAQYLSFKPYPSTQKEATCPQWPLDPEPVGIPTAKP